MSSKSTGCIFLILVLLSFFLPANTYFSTQEIGREGATLHGNETTSSMPVPANEAPFVVVNNQIIYSHIFTLACEFVIGGYILNLNGNFLNDVTVNVESIEIENLPSAISYAQPSDSSGIDRQPGWSVLLPYRSVDYQVWLSRERGGESLSPIVIVRSGDCENNLATVNFRQVRSLE